MKKIRVIAALAVVCTLLAGSYQSQAAPGERYFPETGHSIRSAFQSYWEQHGGLERFGYPLSDDFAEVSALNGQTYTVQYFERAEFEHHPENAAPYDVLLTQLGTMRYRQKYPHSAPGQSPSTDRPQLFPGTDKVVGYRFYSYWKQHGGLMSFGYPISNELIEISDLNNKPYLVQYFERTVFEYHPENQPPYDTLLSQLGKFRYNAKYSPKPSTNPSPTVNAPRLITSDVQGDVVASGNYIFWAGTHIPAHGPGGWPLDSSIYGYNLDTSERFLVTDEPMWKVNLLTDGVWLIWSQAGHDYLIQDYYIATRKEGLLLDAFAKGISGNVAFDNGVLYYIKPYGDKSGIYAFDLATSEERQISTTVPINSLGSFGSLIADSGSLLWSDADASTMPTTYRLHLLDVSSGAESIVATSQFGFLSYAMSKGNIVWSEMPSGISDRRAYLYNTSSGTRQPISKGDARNLVIKGSLVAWTEGPSGQGGGWSVQGYDIASGTRFTIVPDGQPQVNVRAIAGQNIVAYTIDNPLPPPSTNPSVPADRATSNLYLINITMPQPLNDAHLNIPFKDGDVQTSPQASNEYLVWQEGSYSLQRTVISSTGLLAMNLKTNFVQTAADHYCGAYRPAVFGSVVAWAYDPPDSCYTFHIRLAAKDLTTGKAYDLAPEAEFYSQPAIAGHTIVWSGQNYNGVNQQGSWLASFDLDTAQRTMLVSHPYLVNGQIIVGRPFISEKYIVWSEGVAPSGPHNMELGAAWLKLYNRSTGTISVLQQADHVAYSIVGLDKDRIVWFSDDYHGGVALNLTDISSAATTVLYSDPNIHYWYDITFSGNTVVWSAEAPGRSDKNLFGLRLNDPHPVPLVVMGGNQVNPTLTGDWLVWEDDTDASARLNSASLDYLFATSAQRQQDLTLTPTPLPTPPPTYAP